MFCIPTCERIPLSVETSERFLSVDGSGKRVARLALDENIKKRNLLFPFNSMGDVLVSAVEKHQRKNSSPLTSTDGICLDILTPTAERCFNESRKLFCILFHSVLFMWRYYALI